MITRKLENNEIEFDAEIEQYVEVKSKEKVYVQCKNNGFDDDYIFSDDEEFENEKVENVEK